MATLRTDATAVKLVLATSLTEPQVEAFIADASLWVDEELLAFGLSANRLEMIERWLACAFIRCRDLGVKSFKADDIAEQYQVDPQVTGYLLRAAAFDRSGTVRRYFMAPKDIRSAQYRTGEGFVDEALKA